MSIIVVWNSKHFAFLRGGTTSESSDEPCFLLIGKFESYARRSLRCTDASTVATLWDCIQSGVSAEEVREGMADTDSALGRVQSGLVHAASAETGPAGKKASADRCYATAVHRLDMETSGCLVLARSPAAAKNLGEQFATQKVCEMVVGDRKESYCCNL